MTQHQAIIEYLKEHKTISSFMAAVKLGVSNLPLRVSELRLKGYNIVSTKKAHVNRYGVKVHYNEYYLSEEQAENQGTMAQN